MVVRCAALRFSLGVFFLVWIGACAAPLGEEPSLGSTSLELRTLEEVADFGANPAELGMFKHVPADMPSGPRPLVVALHGCTMGPGDYAESGWNDVADDLGFYVIYPAQNSSRNNSLRCFNWGGSWAGAPNAFVLQSTPLNLSDIDRGQSENASIKQMVDHMISTHDIDSRRVYVTGLSAGGGMSAVMLATWPDVFAGGVIVAGIPYGCATISANVGEASACVREYTGSLNRTAAQWATLVHDAFPGYSGAYPKVSIWHGSSDFIVAPGIQTELVEQWTGVHGADQTPDATDTVGDATRRVFHNAAGAPVVESWTVSGMGHGSPVDSAAGCGGVGSYALDVGVCHARLAAEFFGLDGDAPRTDAGMRDGGSTRRDGGSTGTDGGSTGTDGGSIAGDGGSTVGEDGAIVGADGGPTTMVDGGRPTEPGGCALAGCVVAKGSRPGGPLAALLLAVVGIASVRSRRRASRRR